LLPLLVVLALAIRLDSAGPFFLRETRVGRKGRPFQRLRFRIRKQEDSKLVGWAGEPGLTRVGVCLRRFGLDGLPQLVNVLLGHMSFVGPRAESPERVEMLGRLIPHYTERLEVRPGMTGWAQIKTVHDSTIEGSAQELRWDLYYVKNLSLLFDLGIVLFTLKRLLVDGAWTPGMMPGEG
jgi:lipopolysaccharide/colanic/teichoic acid biosynthesis glycosyltransferase